MNDSKRAILEDVCLILSTQNQIHDNASERRVFKPVRKTIACCVRREIFRQLERKEQLIWSKSVKRLLFTGFMQKRMGANEERNVYSMAQSHPTLKTQLGDRKRVQRRNHAGTMSYPTTIQNPCIMKHPIFKETPHPTSAEIGQDHQVSRSI